MRCIEAGLLASLVFLAGCMNKAQAPVPVSAPVPAPVPTPVPAPVPTPVPTASPAARSAPLPPAPAPASPPAPVAAAAPPRPPRYVQLGPPTTPRTMDELRLQLARRLVAAHPDTSYMERAPDRLWAIPVLEIELNADGSVRRINVLRKPSTGNETIPLAIAAVHRAAPYGNVSKLPRPWKVVETFLFDDDLKFKPRILDQ